MSHSGLSWESSASGAAVTALDAINKEMMRLNEMSLARADTTVNFDSVGTMPERMDRMLSALAEGLKCLGVSPCIAAIGVFPIKDQSDTERPALLFYCNLNESDGSGYGRRYAFPPDSRSRSEIANDKVLSALFDQLRDLTAGGRNEQTDFEIIAAPYCVRSSSGGEFDIDAQVFSRFYYCGRLSDPDWRKMHSDMTAQEYLQKLVLFFLAPADGRSASALVAEQAMVLNVGFRNAVGAFLSSTGINAEEKSILFAQRVACHSLLRAHEIANETRFLVRIGMNLEALFSDDGPDSKKATALRSFRDGFQRLLEDVNRLQGTGADSSLKAINWRGTISSWCAARKWQLQADGAWRGYVDDEHMNGAVLHLDFRRVGSGIYLRFVPEYFDRLLDILTRNVTDAWGNSGWAGPRVIEVRADQRNGSSFVLTYRSTGPPVSQDLVQRLFREVVLSDTPGRGTGLWALGLAFSSHGLPYPVVRNIELHDASGVEVEMVFPLIKA